MLVTALIALIASLHSPSIAFTPWQGALIRTAANDCTLCRLTETAVRQPVPPSAYESLSTKCSLLPPKLTQICEQGLDSIVTHLQKTAKAKVPHCTSFCSSPSTLTHSHSCSITHNSYIGLTELMSDVSSSLLPSLCKNDANPLDCAKKFGRVLNVLKGPISNMIRRLGKALECQQFDDGEDSSELLKGSKIDWSIDNIRCASCLTTIRISALVFHQEAFPTVFNVLKDSLSEVCTWMRENDPTALEGAPPCDEIVQTTLDQLRDNEKANDYLCQSAYGCPLKQREEKKEEQKEEL